MNGVRIFGKLPAHGDFVARGLMRDEHDALDRWLSQSLDDARAALGDAFVDRYDSAPPWRCILPDPAPATAEAGALVPSVDAAGRRFPLYLAMTGVALDAAEEAAAACEALLYDAFDGGWDVDALAAAARAAAPGSTAPHAGGPSWWTLGGEGFAPARVAEGRPAALMFEVLRTREEPA